MKTTSKASAGSSSQLRRCFQIQGAAPGLWWNSSLSSDGRTAGRSARSSWPTTDRLSATSESFRSCTARGWRSPAWPTHCGGRLDAKWGKSKKDASQLRPRTSAIHRKCVTRLSHRHPRHRVRVVGVPNSATNGAAKRLVQPREDERLDEVAVVVTVIAEDPGTCNKKRCRGGRNKESKEGQNRPARSSSTHGTACPCL